ncbi:MAG: hypothetical protein ACRD0P_16310, partial [Stackebrandtia sp.]
MPQLLALAGKPQAQHPVVLLSGGKGSGHTRALTAAQQCARYTPHVLVTFKKESETDSDPLALLYLLAFIVGSLRNRQPRFGAVSFLRFQLCYDILTEPSGSVNLDMDPNAFKTIRRLVRDRVIGRLPQPKPEHLEAVGRFANLAPRWVWGGVMAVLMSIRPVNLLVWAGLKRRIFRSFRYMSTFDNPDDPVQCLFDLWTWTKSAQRRPDADRAEKALCEAFLADLAAFHHRR